jgi:acetyl esterase/lipase
MLSAYLGDPANAASPLASPNRAKSLANLAPALVLSAECDPLRDEGEDYGRAMQAAGTPTKVVRLAGMVHGAYNMSAYVPRVAEFNRAIVGFLRPLLERSREAA